jgi:hypothetical protein
MPRSTTRPLLPALAVMALLGLAAPAHAAPARLGDLPAVFRHWLTAVVQQIGMHIDPNGAQAPGEEGQGDIGWHIDPNGLDIGMEIDPNG